MEHSDTTNNAEEGYIVILFVLSKIKFSESSATSIGSGNLLLRKNETFVNSRNELRRQTIRYTKKIKNNGL